ncbi:MAG TPA: hypothetical protein VK658_19780 [Chryseolinea sp.]|nr:hypothetical protein [Chryseolinea sp.]
MARKLGISQGEIIRYLSGQNIGIEEGSNVKLEEQHVLLLYAQFAPTMNFETKSEGVEAARATPHTNDGIEASVAEETPVTEPLPVQVDPFATAEVEVLAGELSGSEALREEVIDPQPTAPLNAESADTIRAPKIELAGLKVIGKIDLPGPRKKEVVPLDEAATDEAATIEGAGAGESTNASLSQKPEPEQRDEGNPGRDENKRERLRRDEGRNQDERRRERSKPQREQRPRKNPISAQREREVEAERERRKEKAAQDKERRTQNYHKRVTHSPPTKAVRLFEEPVEQLNAATFSDEPTTWFGKLVKWLRG